MQTNSFNPNPFAGDDGSITPELAAAMDQPEYGRTEAIVDALSRVLIPVLPHVYPDLNDDGTPITGTSPTQKTDPLARKDADLVTVDFPGGRHALAMFSSAAALLEWNPKARPVPVDVRRLAAMAISRGEGLLTLDPGSDGETWLGRSAVVALAGGKEWTPPWNDPLIVDKITEGFDGYLPGLDRVGIQAGPSGSAIIVLYLIPPVLKETVLSVAQTISSVITTDPYVKARLDVVEIRPFYAGA